MRDPADREIRLALWKLHVLHHAERMPIYGLWMLRELEQHGHRLSPGTLYPLLARLVANGWLRVLPGSARAKARRAYRLTPRGRRLLRTLRAEVTELYEELVLGKEPHHEPPRRRQR